MKKYIGIVEHTTVFDTKRIVWCKEFSNPVWAVIITKMAAVFDDLRTMDDDGHIGINWKVGEKTTHQRRVI